MGVSLIAERCLNSILYNDKKNKSFDELWRNMPHNIDYCSANAQISLQKFPVDGGFHYYYIRQMNETYKNGNCRIYLHMDEREKKQILPNLQKESKGCEIMNGFSTPRSYTSHEEETREIVDLLIVRSTDYRILMSHLDVLEFPSTVDVCQLNIVFSLPKAEEEQEFVEMIYALANGGKYLLYGATRDRQDLRMNVFLLNVHTPHCQQLFLRKFTID
ncbi:unnamed protein product [Caenorhabditis auriculariae]|uniref:Uncharacterized protein n=1 Tax=Caenorhabditis auriculariae TaxID=2777116 RepID=A0A8S1GTJ7_9PELO|nr:unnamed protein product [Caenorhabditis auriculariae]